ncbi:MAG: SURF1 family protein [Methylococcaceae bacterium]
MPKEGISKLRLQIKFNWKIAIGILFLFLVLIRLGFWQLDRAQQKRQIQNARDAQPLNKPVSVENLTSNDKKGLNYKHVTLDGSYDNDKSLLVSNQFFQNRPGYEVITTFKLHSSDQIVLVSRGWIAAHSGGNLLPTIEPVTGTQKLLGTIHIPSSKSFYLPQKIDEPPKWPLRLHHFDINGIFPLFERPVLPFVVRLNRNSPGVLERHWRETKLKPENSISYAIQWFGMALLLLVITIVKSTNILEISRSTR